MVELVRILARFRKDAGDFTDPGRSPTRSDRRPVHDALRQPGRSVAAADWRRSGAHRFWKSGARFSRKAAMPSFWSAVSNSDAKTCRSKRRPSASGVSIAASSAAFAAYTDGSDFDAIVSATLRGLVEQLGRGHDARHQSGALGFGGIHHPSGEDEVGGLVVADRADAAAASRPCRG